MVVVIEQVVKQDQSLKRIGGWVRDRIGTKLCLFSSLCATGAWLRSYVLSTEARFSEMQPVSPGLRPHYFCGGRPAVLY